MIGSIIQIYKMIMVIQYVIIYGKEVYMFLKTGKMSNIENHNYHKINMDQHKQYIRLILKRKYQINNTIIIHLLLMIYNKLLLCIWQKIKLFLLRSGNIVLNYKIIMVIL